MARRVLVRPMSMNVGQRVVIIAPGLYFQRHGEVVALWHTAELVDVKLDEVDPGKVKPFRKSQVVHEAEWFARAADEMEE